MRIVTESEKSERQKIIFQTADKIYSETYKFCMSLIDAETKSPVFYEMQDVEVMSFLENIYTKFFCHGFSAMLSIKKEKMKEHEGTEQQLLEEWIDGIYAFLNAKRKVENNKPDDGIMRLKESK